MRQQQPTDSQTTASKRLARCARAAGLTFRLTRNVLALLGLFFCFLMWRGFTAYDAALNADQQDVSCAKPARCM